MDEQNTGVAVTPNEETANEAPQTTAGIRGEASDGTEYTADSEAVKAFQALFPDVALDMAIGSVISMHEAILAGQEIANSDQVVDVIDIINRGLPKTEEQIADETAEPEYNHEDKLENQA